MAPIDFTEAEVVLRHELAHAYVTVLLGGTVAQLAVHCSPPKHPLAFVQWAPDDKQPLPDKLRQSIVIALAGPAYCEVIPSAHSRGERADYHNAALAFKKLQGLTGAPDAALADLHALARVAHCARRFLVMVDPSKLATVLDKPVPVEVLPFGWAVAWRELVALGGHPHMRRADGEPYRTDNGNYIVDVDFGPMPAPGDLPARIATLPAVVDHGLFVDIVT